MVSKVHCVCLCPASFLDRFDRTLCNFKHIHTYPSSNTLSAKPDIHAGNPNDSHRQGSHGKQREGLGANILVLPAGELRDQQRF